MSKIIKNITVIVLYAAFCISLSVALIITCVKMVNSTETKKVDQIVTLKKEFLSDDAFLNYYFNKGDICDGFFAKGLAVIPEREYIIPQGANLLIKLGDAILKDGALYESGGEIFKAEFSGILTDINNQTENIALKFYDYDNVSALLNVSVSDYMNYYNCEENKKSICIKTTNCDAEIGSARFSSVSHSYLLEVKIKEPVFEYINGSTIDFIFRYNTVSADYIVATDSIKTEDGKKYLNLYNTDTKTIQKCEISVLYSNKRSSSILFIDKIEGRFQYKAADTFEDLNKINYSYFDTNLEIVDEIKANV